MIVEKLLEKKGIFLFYFILDSTISLINGNGMERDISLFNTSHMSIVKEYILKSISTELNFKSLEECIFAQDTSVKTAF